MHSEGLAGKTETFVRYGVSERMELGFGYLWKQDIVRPLASYTVMKEKGDRPSLTTGLMFDSLGGGRQGVFATFEKSFRAGTERTGSLYVGGAVISNEDRARLLAGLHVPLGRVFSASVQFDGKYANLGLTAAAGRIGGAPVHLGIVAARGREFGPLIATHLPLSRR